jgi:hypothetical protein
LAYRYVRLPIAGLGIVMRSVWRGGTFESAQQVDG